jgi:hypothetical protein
MTLSVLLSIVTVHVLHVFHDRGPKAIEIEMRITGDEGIVTPVNLLDAEPAELLTLVVLQLLAHSAPAKGLGDGQHVRPVGRAALSEPGEAVDEPHQPAVLIERARGNSPHLL